MPSVAARVARVKAVQFNGARVVLSEVPRPVGPAGHALVRVSLAGVCNTDLEIVRGYMGFEGTLGHEFVGVVEACDDASWIGRRVCGDINFACRTCAVCLAGDFHHCPSRTVLGIVAAPGAFAEYVAVPCANLHPVADRVEDSQAVFVEPLAAAFEILEQVDVQKSTRTLVLGDGKLGLLCAMALATETSELTVLGRHRRKLNLVSSVAHTVVEGDDLGDARFDLVVEATGSASGLDVALERVRPRGTVVLKSTFAKRPAFDTNRLVIDEITLMGSRCGPFDRALRSLEEARIDPRPLIDDSFPLSEGPAAVARASERGTLKILLRP